MPSPLPYSGENVRTIRVSPLRAHAARALRTLDDVPPLRQLRHAPSRVRQIRQLPQLHAKDALGGRRQDRNW